MRHNLRYGLCIVIALCAAPLLRAQVFDSADYRIKVEEMASDLAAPWALAFLPNGDFLISERDGALLLFQNGKRRSVSAVPKVLARGQGGLLDVVVARDFANTKEVFLTYSAPRKGGAGTALAIAKLDVAGAQLYDLRVLFEQKHATRSSKHFGSRVVEAQNGDLFLTIGDRGKPKLAQSRDHFNGKVMRITRAGQSAIYSLGHRNAQGAALDAKGRLWTVEHGAKGGDEVNLIEAGKNYGWPIIAYGTHYIGTKIGEGTAKAGLEQPAYYWDPSIAPSGMMIYSGQLFDKWRGNIFIGALKFDYISRLNQSNGKLIEREKLLFEAFGRIRDIRQAKDGTIWFLSVADGAAYRIAPLR